MKYISCLVFGIHKTSITLAEWLLCEVKSLFLFCLYVTEDCLSEVVTSVQLDTFGRVNFELVGVLDAEDVFQIDLDNCELSLSQSLLPTKANQYQVCSTTFM